MIIGNGLIASAFDSQFKYDQNILVFASGVSNSREIRKEAFLRERKMLTNTLQFEKNIIYFSTCSVNDPELRNSPYVVHKKEMEALVRSSKEYTIFRLPQVVGKNTNPNTLTNYLYKQIISGAHFQVWRYAKRNLIDVGDVASIATYLVRADLVSRVTTNIACPFFISIPDLVSIFELVLGKKANYSLIDAGGAYPIDSNLVCDTARKISIVFDGFYIEKLIRKYYGP